MAGTLTITHQKHRSIKTLSLAWTSTSGGAVSGNLTEAICGVILRVVFKPGTSGNQPTDLYDVVLNDADGLDVLAGLGANLSNAANTQKCPLVGDAVAAAQPIAVDSTLELQVSNAGNAKSGTVVVYYA